MTLLDGVNKQQFVSDRIGMPVDVTADTAYVNSISGETVQLYYFSNAYLTCAAAGETTASNWAALTNTSSFQIDFNDKTYVITPDFTGDASMANVAASIQTALQAVGGALASVTCAYSIDHFVFTTVKDESGDDMANSISVLSNPSSNTGTDIAGPSWMNGKYGSGVVTPATLTTDAGEAAGTIVMAKLNYSGILDSLGAMIGNDQETSLSWTTNTVLPKKYLQPFQKFHIEDVAHKELIDIAYSIGKGLTTNGEWALDHRSGMIVGRKATTGTSDTAAYKVQTQTTGGGTAIAATVNVGKIGGNTVTAGAGAVAAGTQRITLASDDPAVTALQIMDDWDATEDSAIGSDGAVVMLKAISAQQTAMTADDDAVIPVANLYGEQVIAGYDWSTSKIGTIEGNPLDEHYVEEELIDTTNVAAATNYYPSSAGMSMSNYAALSIGVVTSGGVTFTIEGTNDDASSPDWQDITLSFWNAVNGIPCTGYVDQSMMLVGNCPWKKVRIKSVTSDATNGVQYHIKRVPFPVSASITKHSAGGDLFFDSDGDNTAQALKASAGRLYKLHIINTNSSGAYVQLFNVAAGSVTVGTTTPNYVIFVPAEGAVIEDFDPSGDFDTAITYACTTTATGSGDPTTGLIVSGIYK